MNQQHLDASQVWTILTVSWYWAGEEQKSRHGGRLLRIYLQPWNVDEKTSLHSSKFAKLLHRQWVHSSEYVSIGNASDNFNFCCYIWWGDVGRLKDHVTLIRKCYVKQVTDSKNLLIYLLCMLHSYCYVSAVEYILIANYSKRTIPMLRKCSRVKFKCRYGLRSTWTFTNMLLNGVMQSTSHNSERNFSSLCALCNTRFLFELQGSLEMVKLKIRNFIAALIQAQIRWFREFATHIFQILIFYQEIFSQLTQYSPIKSSKTRNLTIYIWFLRTARTSPTCQKRDSTPALCSDSSG